MIEINREIRSLLYEHDYVTIPDLGAFIAHYEPSAYRSESNTFTPPNRKLSFNSVLKQDDGLLSTALMKKSGVSSKKTREIITSYVKDVKQSLISKEKFYIEGVGSLELTASDNIIFDPITLNFFKESYGFETLYSFNNASYTIDRRFYSDVYSTGLNSSIESMEIDFPFNKKRQPFYSKVLYVAPVAALLIGLLTTVMINPNNKMEKANSSLYPGDYIESVKGWFKSSDAVKPEEVKAYNVVFPVDDVISTDPQPLQILVGVFKDERKANKLYNILVLNDFKPSVIDIVSQKQVVVSVINEEEAKAASLKLKQLLGQGGVLIKK